jgi:glutathione S-transferase
MSMFTFYWSPGSSSMAVHIMLHEVGAPFESRLTQLHLKQHLADDYLAVNPEAKVPTLAIDGRPLTEVAGILYYLARQYPETRLWPTGDIEAEAQVISWMSFIAATVHPARRIGEARWREVIGIADQRLGPRTWAVGDRCTIADIHLFRLYWRFEMTLNPDPAAYPNLTAHHARMMARPAVKKTIEIESAVGYNLP